MRPFHLAFPVTDIEAARQFYVGTLGCRVGREAERWIDFDFGEVPKGQSRTQTLQLANHGGSILGVTSIGVASSGATWMRPKNSSITPNTALIPSIHGPAFGRNCPADAPMVRPPGKRCEVW